MMNKVLINPAQIAAYVVFLVFFSSVHAEELPDPTRPPAGLFATDSGTNAGRGVAESRSVGLHTVIISDTRRAAIIDGQTVELGGEHGGAKLVEVTEGGVVMQRAQSRQVLALFPDVKIIRKDTSNKESAAQVKQPSPVNKKQIRKHKVKPAVHKEEK